MKGKCKCALLYVGLCTLCSVLNGNAFKDPFLNLTEFKIISPCHVYGYVDLCRTICAAEWLYLVTEIHVG